jgi:hypothetical protein
MTRIPKKSKTFIVRQDKLILYNECGSTQKSYMYQDQDGKCLICLTDRLIEELVIDHDHDSGLVRGLLCTSCNLGIGIFKDNIGLLKRAIWYLRWNHQ